MLTKTMNVTNQTRQICDILNFKYDICRTVSHNKEYIKLINTRRWQLLRKTTLDARPLCERCKKEGRLTEAEEVHHIKPIESTRFPERMRALAYDPTNLMSVCRDCHRLLHIEIKREKNNFIKRAQKQHEVAKNFVEFITRKHNNPGGIF